jgi:hypothetical protein
MTRFSISQRFGSALACAVLVLSSLPASAEKNSATAITANAGTTFVMSQTPTNASLFPHVVDGVAQVSGLGNCTVHFSLLATAMSATPFEIAGTLAITNSTGATTLNADVAGVGTMDPNNGNFLNIHYEVVFTGGTGAMAGATGFAQIQDAAVQALLRQGGPVRAGGLPPGEPAEELRSRVARFAGYTLSVKPAVAFSRRTGLLFRSANNLNKRPFKPQSRNVL